MKKDPKNTQAQKERNNNTKSLKDTTRAWFASLLFSSVSLAVAVCCCFRAAA